MNEIKGTHFRNANCLMNEIQAGHFELPVKILVGKSGFTITKENVDAMALGVLLATDEGWEDR